MYNPINMTNTQKWKQDVATSVDFYNNWFLNYAPTTYRNERVAAIKRVDKVLKMTECFRNINIEVIMSHPEILQILRLSTAPPIARDRLVGLAGVNKSLVDSMDKDAILPPRMKKAELAVQLDRIVSIIHRLLDVDIFPWIQLHENPSGVSRKRAASIVADRLCGSLADPLIRNEQEKRQLQAISTYLNRKGYRFVESKSINSYESMPVGTFSFHLNIPVDAGMEKPVNIPVDVAIKRKDGDASDLPLLIECKSAGDFTNTNKRRKEEAQKMEQLRHTYGDDVRFVLFLCGYFDSSYLGYEAAEGIDWIWEHRIEDFEMLDL
ncbi:MAG: XamI family restriction endonuclease [Paludibacteraceae bacterium]|nr:XamI family restriction endonuclease [Paludibacteraceae bacterium]